MIGIVLGCAVGVAVLTAAVLVAKRPLDDHARWGKLLEHATQTCRSGLTPPVSEDYGGWDIGAPVQPVQFARQLGSLQAALARANQPAISESTAEVGVRSEKDGRTELLARQV